MGKAYLSEEAGLPLRASGLAMILELIQLVWIGLAIAVAIVPVERAQEWIGVNLHSGYLYITGFLMLLCLIAFVLALPWILRTAWHGRNHTQVRPIAFLGAIAAMFAAWLVFGYSFWMLAAAFKPVSAYDIPLFVFTLVASFLIGLAVIVVPSGIGIREGVMVLILGAYMAEPLAVLLAALSRVVLFLSELTSVLLLKAILRVAGTDRLVAKDDLRLSTIGEGKQDSGSTQRRRR
jgi:uncharacterized membrane protein YbhN (UPF0104 family)